MQALHSGTTLQGGKYIIKQVLGLGGFGITYLAENTMLNGKVAIKEFFFREYCERDESTSYVTIPTSGNRQLVERFKQKFVKEARTIFRLNHPNIVRILDIFEENGTAYYVMDYIEGESLAEMVKRRGSIPEAEAIGYIREVAKALTYIHGKSINHLDIKPANIMKRKDNGQILVIDFGVAKQYDAETSEGTTTTPVGISHGYSPAEQYLRNGVQTFSPQSDVYSLAATLYKLLTGDTPPEAMNVLDAGLPTQSLVAKGISPTVVTAIEAAMQSRQKHTKTIDVFVSNLGEVADAKNPKKDNHFIDRPFGGGTESPFIDNNNSKTVLKKKVFWASVFSVVVILICLIFYFLTISKNRFSDVIDNNVLTVNGVSYRMVPVKGDTFQMGATSQQENPDDDEIPVHAVTLSDYSIGETEVTQGLWMAVMGSNPSKYKGEDLPVENVSWEDCQSFIERLNILTGAQYRLPTEAEWEYAARGGNMSRNTQYSGSSIVDDVAWYGNNCKETCPVKTKIPNELGIYDMCGNVWEWCQDWSGKYSSNSEINPKGPVSGSHRMTRGGSWCDSARYCRSANRNGIDPLSCSSNLGFRLAR